MNATEKYNWYVNKTNELNRLHSMSAKELVNHYKTDFDSLIYHLSIIPGSNKPIYKDTFVDSVIEEYRIKYSVKTVRRLLKQNARNFAIQGYSFSCTREYETDLFNDGLI